MDVKSYGPSKHAATNVMKVIMFHPTSLLDNVSDMQLTIFQALVMRTETMSGLISHEQKKQRIT